MIHAVLLGPIGYRLLLAGSPLYYFAGVSDWATWRHLGGFGSETATWNGEGVACRQIGRLAFEVGDFWAPRVFWNFFDADYLCSSMGLLHTGWAYLVPRMDEMTTTPFALQSFRNTQTRCVSDEWKRVRNMCPLLLALIMGWYLMFSASLGMIWTTTYLKYITYILHT